MNEMFLEGAQIVGCKTLGIVLSTWGKDILMWVTVGKMRFFRVGSGFQISVAKEFGLHRQSERRFPYSLNH